jgi:hypothetical protein
MTYTVIKKELRGELVLTEVAYIINGQQHVVEVYHSIFGLTEQGIIDKIEQQGIVEQNRLVAIEAAKELISTINL